MALLTSQILLYLLIQALSVISPHAHTNTHTHTHSLSLSAGHMFIACLEVAVQIPRVYPSNKLLRSRFISSVHRLVECLGPALLPYLPAALEVLVTTQVRGAGSKGVYRESSASLIVVLPHAGLGSGGEPEEA